MNKWMLIIMVALVLLQGCSVNSPSPSNNTTNPTTAPTPGESVMPVTIKEFPAVSDPYDVDQAVSNGDVVNVHGKMYNLDKWKAFLSNLDVGAPDQVRIMQYTIEDDPIFYELVYDGAETITYTFDNSMDGFGNDAGRPSTVCRAIELEEDKELGSYYKLTGCDNETNNTFWFPNIEADAE